MNKKTSKLNLEAAAIAAESLAKDYEAFLEFLRNNPVKLAVRTMRLGKKACFEINSLLGCAPEIWVKEGHYQDSYVEIEFFYYFSLRYDILYTVKTGSAYILQERNKAEKFLGLTPVERYGIMLSYMMGEYWNQEAYNIRMEINPRRLLFMPEYLRQLNAGAEMDCSKINDVFLSFPRLFAIFGLIEIQWKKELEKNDKNGMEWFRTTDLGISVLKRFDIDSIIGMREEKMEAYCLKKFCALVNSQAEDVKEFLKPAELKGDVTYLLKVTLEDCVRKIRIGGQETLETLHLMIQEAVDFDNDHLYFFEISWGRGVKRYNHPYCEGEAYYADEVLLKDILLYEKMTFIYLFDFGDDWEFRIEVEKILPEFTRQPEITERKGENPQQYADDDIDF